ncbi:MAG: hypothetical protein F4Y50_12935 [Dehalococcoidia bacterium]|nr:hypothetical protein [Dehalococcoidia bacterium]
MRDTDGGTVEDLIAQWRAYLLRHEAVHTLDVEEVESRLRDEAASLQDAGLADAEAFLIALRRVGETDSASREFVLEHFGRLWERPDSAQESEGEGVRFERTEFVVVIGLAVVAALAIKVPELFGYRIIDGDAVYARNLSLFVLPMLVGYFVWKRGLSGRASLWLVLPFVAAAVFANIFPFDRDAHTELLTALHLPFALWLVVGFAYVGGRWRDVERRTDFVRFSGELFIYYVLIALGGGVFSLLTWGMFEAIDLDIGDFIAEWVLPCGAMGAVLVGAWLVEARQGVAQNIAPMLSRIFTPLFAVMLPIFLVVMILTGEWVDMDRDMLIGFDIMLALVLGLLLFSVSARDSRERPGVFDALQLLLVAAAIAADLMALSAIVGRISEFGFTPNRAAALGGNIVLLANLAWSAWLYLQFFRARGEFSALVRWQVNYLPVYAVWAAVVVVVFPPLFGYA